MRTKIDIIIFSDSIIPQSKVYNVRTKSINSINVYMGNLPFVHLCKVAANRCENGKHDCWEFFCNAYRHLSQLQEFVALAYW